MQSIRLSVEQQELIQRELEKILPILSKESTQQQT